MKVQVHAADQGGCGYYRMIWPAQAVAAAELCDVEIVLDGQLQMDLTVDRHGVKKCVDVEPVDADVLVLQRPLSKLLAEAIPILQAQGLAVVVELDDDFQDIHPENVAWREVQPELNAESNWRWLRKSINHADVFVCTTAQLARKYGRNTPTRVIPNYLPAHYRDVKPNAVWSDPWRLGWSGSVATHPNDLQAASVGVQRAISEMRAELHIIGSGLGVADKLGVPAEAVHGTQWVPIEDYPASMAMPHVGVVPLGMTPFNQAKSWLKGLEFAGAGVPFVASATEPYRALHTEHSLGRVAKKPVDWVKHLRALSSEAVWRAESERQRRYVLDNMMIDQHAAEWAAAWLSAGTRARGRGVRASGGFVAGRVFQAAEMDGSEYLPEPPKAAPHAEGLELTP